MLLANGFSDLSLLFLVGGRFMNIAHTTLRFEARNSLYAVKPHPSEISVHREFARRLVVPLFEASRGWHRAINIHIPELLLDPLPDLLKALLARIVLSGLGSGFSAHLGADAAAVAPLCRGKPGLGQFRRVKFPLFGVLGFEVFGSFGSLGLGCAHQGLSSEVGAAEKAGTLLGSLGVLRLFLGGGHPFGLDLGGLLLLHHHQIVEIELLIHDQSGHHCVLPAFASFDLAAHGSHFNAFLDLGGPEQLFSLLSLPETVFFKPRFIRF